MAQYNVLLSNIGNILNKSRHLAYQVINQILVKTYWEIGKQIVEYEQENNKQGYGNKLFDKIANDLKQRYGKGFSRSNVIYMRLLYKKYPNSQTLSDQLSWSHYVELLIVDDDLAKSFYEKQCIKEKWSVRELKRQIKSALFYRVALSKDPKKILKLSLHGQTEHDLIKDPYVLEFLGLEENYTEKEFEQKIIDNLNLFLLELGKGFTFVSRQFRITLGNNHYYVDLVFYHRILKCFILIDLKIGKASHLDVGQMNMYLNYFKSEENQKNDNPPIGIILSAQKDQIQIKYALGGISNKLFVSKYQLFMPDKQILEKRLKKLIEQ